MSPALLSWLENQFGVAYGRHCDSYFVGTTRPRPRWVLCFWCMAPTPCSNPRPASPA